MGFAFLLAALLAAAFVVTMLVFRIMRIRGRRVDRHGKPLLWDHPIEHR
jgi:predicted outer membrane lipoprotein